MYHSEYQKVTQLYVKEIENERMFIKCIYDKIVTYNASFALNIMKDAITKQSKYSFRVFMLNIFERFSAQMKYDYKEYAVKSSALYTTKQFTRYVLKCRLQLEDLFIYNRSVNSSRRFFKDGSSSTPCMEVRMATHVQGSIVSNLKFQCLTVDFSVNK